MIALLDPNPDPSTQINVDPDPQPCFYTTMLLTEQKLRIRIHLFTLLEIRTRLFSVNADRDLDPF